jgi:hypothetical protein
MRKLILLIASAAVCAVPAVASAAPPHIVGGSQAVREIGLNTIWGSSVVRPARHSATRASHPVGLSVVWGSSVVGPVKHGAPRPKRPIDLGVVWGT